jgi:hypothetical protein
LRAGHADSKATLRWEPSQNGLFADWPQPAQSDGGASGQTERLTFRIANLEVAVNANRAIGVDSDLCWHSFDPNRSFSVP